MVPLDGEVGAKHVGCEPFHIAFVARFIADAPPTGYPEGVREKEAVTMRAKLMKAARKALKALKAANNYLNDLYWAEGKHSPEHSRPIVRLSQAMKERRKPK